MLFPTIAVDATDTVASVEARLMKAILDNTKLPGIKPVYTMMDVRDEARRLHTNFQNNLKIQAVRVG